ncbi:MAG: acyltransferase [Lachnospiraceae bacterium]|nr:acyltransferase [Lachnospiraceae bacterium]
MKKGFKWTYIVLILCMIAAIGITVYRNLAYRYEMQGDVVDLSACYAGATGYDVSDASDANGRCFTMSGEDPQFLLSSAEGGIGGTIGGIALTFGDVWSDSEPLPVQVFYAGVGESFTEKHSVKSALHIGQQRLLIPIPLGEYMLLRFDIDGDFKLKAIEGCSGKMKATAYVSEETVIHCLWYIPAIIIGFCLIYWAHSVRMKESGLRGGQYVRTIFFGAEPSKDREVYLDYLRILAAVFVILAHACSPMVDLADANWKRLVLVCGLSLGLTCNLLYVMLSGTLLLGAKSRQDEGVLPFYIRRASKVIIPLIAYYLLLLSLNDEVGFLPPKNLGAAFKRIVTGAPDVGPHLWLIYTIVALYLVTPFLRVMMQHLSDRMIFSLAAVILVLNILTNYLPLFGMTFGASTFLAGWEGVFLLGYIMTRQNELSGAAKRNKALLIAAVAAYAITVGVVYHDSDQMNYVYNNASTMVIISCGIFALFLQNKDKFTGRSNLFVRLCSKYSYSIILIHWYALFVVVQGRFHITALRFGCIGGIIASVVLTFVVCTILSIVFDNTVVIVCNVLFDKLSAGLLSLTNKNREKA